MSRLAEIFAHKRTELAARQAERPLAAVIDAASCAAPPLDFVAALRGAPARPALIAELKAASPSRGVLAPDFDPRGLARIYADNGAAAISVLTDARYFRGSLTHLEAVRSEVPGIPLLRKDFICDPYQVYEARAAGADAVLLIAAALLSDQLAALHELTHALGMAALVEVHAADELDAALTCRPGLVGINNRNLHDFTVSLATTEALAPRIPDDICLVAESGIFTAADIARLAQVGRDGHGRGTDAILVGEALVTAADVGAKTRELSSTST
jgi:indole-3-glycerol phosphate synthase